MLYLLNKILIVLFIAVFLVSAQVPVPVPVPTVHWNISLPSNLLSSFYYSLEMAVDGSYLLLGQKYPQSTQFIAFDPNNGSIIWSWPQAPTYKVFDYTVDLILLSQPSGFIGGYEPITLKVLFTTDIPNNSTLSGVISGPYFALLIKSDNSTQGQYAVVGFSASSGELLWTIDLPQLVSLVSCSGSHFCILDGNTVSFVHGINGNQRWSHPGNGVSSQGTNEDYVIIGDGSFLNEHLVYLVDTNTGNRFWNISLGDSSSAYDWALTPNLALVTFITIFNEKRNAYPASISSLRLSDGGFVFGDSPKGDTYGKLSFFNNYDFTALGDEEVAHYDGQTGKILCALQNIMAYNMVTRPVTTGDFFFVTYFQRGWNTQNVVKLSCN